MEFLDLCYSQHDYFTTGEVHKVAHLLERDAFKLRNRQERSSWTFKQLIDSLPNYLLLSDYKHSKEHVTMMHLTCGTVWQVTPDGFKNQGTRCPTCCRKGMSKLEKAVARKLQEMNVSYLREYRFSECRDKYPLPFDFVLLDKEGNLYFQVLKL